MKKLLTEEQIKHLNTLDSKKKKRKYLLNCIITNISNKEVIFTNGEFEATKEQAEILNEFYSLCKENKGDVIKISVKGGGFSETTVYERNFTLGEIADKVVEISLEKMAKTPDSSSLEFDSPKKKYTSDVRELIKLTYSVDEMRECFNESRLTHPVIGFKHKDFEDYKSYLK